MEPQGGRGISAFRVTKRSTKLRRLSKTTRPSRVHVQTVGLNAETKKVSAPSRRREISLDIPFYRTFWRGTGFALPAQTRSIAPNAPNCTEIRGAESFA